MSVLLVLGLASLTRTLADGPSTETTESTTRSDGPSCGCSTTSFVLVYGAAWVSTCFNPGCLGGLSRPWGRPWGFVIRIAFFFDIWCLYPCFFVFFAASLVVSKVFLFKFPSFVISGTSNIEKEAARWCGASDVHPFQDGIPTGASPELPPQENRDTLSPQKSSAKSQGYFIATPKTTLIPQSNIATTGIDGPKNSPMI